MLSAYISASPGNARMSAILAQIAILFVRALVGLASALLSDVFFRGLIIEALQVLVNKTDNEWDNKLLERAREVWERQ